MAPSDRRAPAFTTPTATVDPTGPVGRATGTHAPGLTAALLAAWLLAGIGTSARAEDQPRGDPPPATAPAASADNAGTPQVTGLPPVRPSFARAPGRLDPSLRPRRITAEIEPLGATIDAGTTRFRGDATIEFVVTRPTRTIELHASGLVVQESSLGDEPIEPPQASTDGQRLRWTLPKALEVGDHRLGLRYEGTIGVDAEGLYRIDNPGPDGPRSLLATQMEPTGARRLLPTWDEPSYRIPYELSVVMPAGMSAVSNTAVTAREVVEPERATDPPRERWLFAPTPPMPSYLLALFVGPLEKLEAAPRQPRLRAWTMPGRSREAALALEATGAVLDAYRDYFGQPYTLDKLDSIALPGGFGGAMENWGAIAYHESTLLYDPATSPPGRRQQVWSIVAHEVAHQWFGNLVTMGWWDDLWLNEGFATWMSARTVQQMLPDEPVWVDAALGVDEAKTLDALPGAQPVRRPVADDQAAFASFDQLTYDKGMAFIRMLEQWLGPEAFRDGLRRYMARHAYGNATTADLWRELSAASGRPVARIADAWIRRSGLPRVDVESRCIGGRLEVRLAQARFQTGREGRQPGLAKAWPLPLTLGRYDAQGRLVERRSVFVDGPTHRERFDGCGGTLKANLDGAGYVRSRPAAADAARLTRLFTRLPETERLDLLMDRWALALADDASIDGWLALVVQLGQEPSPAAWRQVREAAMRLEGVFGATAGRGWRTRLAGVASQRLQALGLRPRDGETDGDRRSREELLRLLGRLDDAPTVLAAQALWQEALASGRPLDALPASLHRGVAEVVGRHADAPTLERLLSMAAAEPDATRRHVLWRAIGAVRDPALAARVAALAAGDVPPPDEASWLLTSLAAAGHRDLAWRTLERDHARLAERSSPWSRAYVAPSILEHGSGPAAARQLLDWQQRRLGASAMGPARITAAAIEVNGRWRTSAGPALQRWGAAGPASVVTRRP